MGIIDILNRIGSKKVFRPIGRLLLNSATSLRFDTLTRIAGRHMVSAFAAAPAILLTKSTIEDALRDEALLFKAMEFTVQEMGLDTFCLVADLSLEAEACGCEVSFSKENLPTVTSHPVGSASDLTEIRVPNPSSDGRMHVIFDTIRRISRHYTMIKVAVVTGPFTLAAHLAGTELYLDLRKNRQKVEAILDFSLKVATRYARELVRAGADMILLAEPVSSQLSPRDYETFSLPRTREFISDLGKPCILHICGKTDHLLEKMCSSGAAVLSIDDIDIRRAVNTVPKEIVLAGNISTSSFWMSSPEGIKEETSKLLDIVKDRKEFIIAPGCDLAPNTPLENILAFVRTAKGIEN
jgi:uroporphyrinogen decarboxylase